MNKLRIVFIGTPDFAVESLRSLLEAGKNVVAVITVPDRKAGRGQKINESAVKKFAASKYLPVLQPTNLKNESFLEELKSFNANLQIVVAFRMLPELVWNMPQFGTFNLHASLLPNYRGAAPINWAIINGEKETGVTTFFLKHQIDTGDLILQERLTIEQNETAGTLHDKLMVAGGKLVVKTVELIKENEVNPQPQKEIATKEAPKIFKHDCKVNWNKPGKDIDRLVRGMSPFPSAWSTLQSEVEKKNIKIFSVEVTDREPISAGMIEIVEKDIFVGAADKTIKLSDIQVEGKKRMPIKDLLNGFDFNHFSFIKD